MMPDYYIIECFLEKDTQTAEACPPGASLTAHVSDVSGDLEKHQEAEAVLGMRAVCPATLSAFLPHSHVLGRSGSYVVILWV